MQSTETCFRAFSTKLAAILQFHTGMRAQVVMAGSHSSSFPVNGGMKQRRVLAPINVNMFLVAITLVSHSDLQPSDSVEDMYCLDDGLSNLQRLQAKAYLKPLYPLAGSSLKSHKI